MKKNNIIIKTYGLLQLLMVAGVMVLMYSCADNELVQECLEKDKDEIHLAVDKNNLFVSDAQATRGENNLDNEYYPLLGRTKLGLFVMHEDRYNVVDGWESIHEKYSEYSNIPTSLTDEDAKIKLVPSKGIYYPLDGKQVQAIVYSPYMVDSKINWTSLDFPGWTFRVEDNQATDVNIKNSDLIVAKHFDNEGNDCTFRSESTVGLKFQHAMSKVRFYFRIKQDDTNDCDRIDVTINNIRIKGGIRVAHLDWGVEPIDTRDNQMGNIQMAQVDAYPDDDGYYTYEAYALVFPVDDMSAIDGAQPISFTVKFYNGSSLKESMTIPDAGIPFDTFKKMEIGKAYNFKYDESVSPAKGLAPRDGNAKIVPDGNYTLQITEEDW